MRAPHLTVHPLSSSQREIWFDQMLHEGVPLYNIGGYVHLPGAIDVVMFEAAVRLLVQRHDVLRLVLMDTTDDDGLPLQRFVEPRDVLVQVPLQDVSGEADPWAAAQTWMQARLEQPYALAGEQPLWRYDLVKLGPSTYCWLLQYHHLISDGWGSALLNRSLAEIYSGLAESVRAEIAPSPSYTAFIAQDRAYVESPAFERDRRYWLEQYANGAPEPLLQPRLRVQPGEALVGSAVQTMSLPRAMYRQLEALATEHGASVFHVLLAALYVYFTRTGQRDDFAVGLPVLNRANAQMKATAGLFVGVMPAHFQFGRELSFGELIQAIGKALKGHYRHQRFPVSEVNRAVGLEAMRSALFDVTMSFEAHDHSMRFGDVDGWVVRLFDSWSQPPLMVTVQEYHDDADVKVSFVYNQAYFEAEGIAALQSRFLAILEAATGCPGHATLHDLPVMTAKEARQLRDWNQTEVGGPQDTTIVELFEAQVEHSPAACAVVFEGEALSYAALDQRANQVAHALIAQGVGPDTLVGLCVPRSLEMVIGLLGILKAGGAYVPLDPDYPPERLRFMVEDSRVPIVLTHGAVQDRLPKSAAGVLRLDEAEAWTAQPDTQPARRACPQDLAYVLYTSGSTGSPKGVAVEQGALAQHSQCMRTLYQISSTDRVLQFASLNFDTSIEQIFVAWLGGGALVLLQSNLISAEALAAEVVAQQVTVADLPPAYWQQLCDMAADSRLLETVRLLILGGEALPLSLARATRQRFPDLTCLNAYGPTEAVITSTTYPLPASAVLDGLDVMPIGAPLANTRIYLLDSQRQPVPPGIAGELCIAGAGLARGYLNRPELTAEKFIKAEVLGRSERLYCTGDLARWRPDGNLEYLGRIDHQVKLRGFRIELGEIEAALSSHSDVRAATVVVHERQDDKRLAAYVVLREPVEPSALKAWVKNLLPAYMVPSSVMVLDALPLTPNGKIDRRALPEPDLGGRATHHVAPRTQTELRLIRIWESVLHRQSISIEDNFFDLGGHSLIAVRLMAHIQQEFGQKLRLSVLFQSPTIARLAEQLQAPTDTQREPYLVPIQPQGTLPPLYCLPGVGGNTLYYCALATHLGRDQPVYGLDTPGMDALETLPRSVEEHARILLETLLRHQPQGPYCLAGHSAGARVAFEMARQLECQGHCVERLVIFDEPPVHNADQFEELESHSKLDWMLHGLKVLESIHEHALGLTAADLVVLPQEQQRWELIAERMRQLNVSPTAMSAAQLQTKFDIRRILSFNHARYRPEGNIKASVVLLRAAEKSDGSLVENEIQQDFGWQAHTQQPVTVRWVQGCHTSILHEPQVQRMARHLKQALDAQVTP